MTPGDFAAAIGKLSVLVKGVGSPDIASDLSLLQGMFTQVQDKTVAATLKKLTAPLDTSESGPREAELGDHQLAGFDRLRALLRQCDEFAISASASKFSKDLRGLIEVLDRCDNFGGTSPFVKYAIARLNEPKKAKKKAVAPVRGDVVRIYCRRLEEALGDEEFTIAYHDLSNDKSITAAELSEIASTFAKVKARSRSKALQAVLHRHQSLMELRAKANSRDGRSAA